MRAARVQEDASRMDIGGFVVLVKAALIAIFVAILGGTPRAENETYVINPGDVLAISVWKELDLTREVVVLPDGTISFPLAGQLEAAGLTLLELERDIEKRLDRFIPSPVVSASVVSASGNKFYVVGEVNNPGEYLITRPTDIMQAISLAGGLTPFASENRIKILRTADGGPKTFQFRYEEVEGGEALNTNIRLRSGDVVVVPGTSLF